jgi:phage terminase large subunit-like protein
MTRAEFIQSLVVRGGLGRDGGEGLVELAAKRADLLEKSGVAPWGDAPRAPAGAVQEIDPDAANGGERACAIFFKIFGDREYVWADLPETERHAWEEVYSSLTGQGKRAVDIVTREREGCAKVVEAMIQKSDPSRRQLLVYVAEQIRARR